MSGGPLMCIRTRSGRILSEFRDVLKSGEIVTKNCFSDLAKSGSHFGLSNSVFSSLIYQKSMVMYHCGVTISSRILSSTSAHSCFGIRYKCTLSQAARRLYLSEFNIKFHPNFANFEKQSVRLFCSPHQAYKCRTLDPNSLVEVERIEASPSHNVSSVEDKNRTELNSEFLGRYDRIKHLLHEPSHVESVLDNSTNKTESNTTGSSCGCNKSKHSLYESFNKDSKLQLESERDKDKLNSIDSHCVSSVESHSDQFNTISQSEAKLLSINWQAGKIDAANACDAESESSSIVKGSTNSDASTFETSQRNDSLSNIKLNSASLSGNFKDGENSTSFAMNSSSTGFQGSHFKISGENQKGLSVDTESEEKMMNIVEKKLSVEEPTEKMGLFKRFHHTYKQYGKVLVVVHGVTSTVWTAVFYYAAMSGVDVEPALRWLGAGDTIISFYTMPGVGNAAVAYLFYKLATPLRYPVTIAGTHLAVKYLRKFGYMPPVAQENTLRSLMSESKSQMKDKYHRYHDHIDDIRNDYKDKIGDIRHEYKDKIGEIRSEYKDKYHRYQDQIGEIRSEYKGKIEDIRNEYKEQVKNKYHRYHDQIDDIRSEFRESKKKLDDWSKIEK